MDDSITLLTALVTIMIHTAAECIGKDTQISNAKRFKKEAKRF